jgi:hypothetical protein
MNARALSLALVLMLLATIASAQTRKIGHRSHSGSPATFAMMMREDHLGEFSSPEPIYVVDPFIAKVRRYYEEVAKRNPQPEVEVKRSEMDSIPTKPNATNPPAGTSPAPDSPKEKKKNRSPEASTQDIPAPDFLVKARPRKAPTVDATEGVPTRSNLWLLAGLLACTVAPCLFVASALMQRRPADG